MVPISKYCIIIFAFSANLFSTTIFDDSTDNNKIYQRTVYRTDVEQNDSITCQWDDTQPYFSKTYANINVIMKNGHLESNLILHNGNPLNVEPVYSLEGLYETIFAKKFIDSITNNRLFYFYSMKFGPHLSWHQFNLDPDYDNFKLDYLNYGYTANFGKGYGWTFDKFSNISLYKSVGISIDNFIFSSTSDEDNKISVGDNFESGIRYHFNKDFAINASIYENITYDYFKIDKWLVGKAIEVGGYLALDNFLTSHLINNKIKYTPIYQFAYQTAWSYLLYSLKKSNFNFPLEKDSKAIYYTDTRFSIGFSFSVFK